MLRFDLEVSAGTCHPTRRRAYAIEVTLGLDRRRRVRSSPIVRDKVTSQADLQRGESVNVVYARHKREQRSMLCC